MAEGSTFPWMGAGAGLAIGGAAGALGLALMGWNWQGALALGALSLGGLAAGAYTESTARSAGSAFTDMTKSLGNVVQQIQPSGPNPVASNPVIAVVQRDAAGQFVRNGWKPDNTNTAISPVHRDGSSNEAHVTLKLANGELVTFHAVANHATQKADIDGVYDKQGNLVKFDGGLANARFSISGVFDHATIGGVTYPSFSLPITLNKRDASDGQIIGQAEKAAQLGGVHVGSNMSVPNPATTQTTFGIPGKTAPSPVR